MRARLWGGGAVAPDELVAQMEKAGYESASAHPPVGAYRMFAARRRPQGSAAEPFGAESATA